MTAPLTTAVGLNAVKPSILLALIVDCGTFATSKEDAKVLLSIDILRFAPLRWASEFFINVHYPHVPDSKS